MTVQRDRFNFASLHQQSDKTSGRTELFDIVRSITNRDLKWERQTAAVSEEVFMRQRRAEMEYNSTIYSPCMTIPKTSTPSKQTRALNSQTRTTRQFCKHLRMSGQMVPSCVNTCIRLWEWKTVSTLMCQRAYAHHTFPVEKKRKRFSSTVGWWMMVVSPNRALIGYSSVYLVRRKKSQRMASFVND